MKNFKLLLMLAAMFTAAGLIFTSCDGDDKPEAGNLTVTPSVDRTIGYEGTTTAWNYGVTVDPESMTWTASSDKEWAVISNPTKTGSGNFTLAIEEYPATEGTDPRVANITVKANGAADVTFKVTQSPYETTLSVVPTSHNFDQTGGSLPVEVTSNTTWTPEVTSGSDWISIEAVNDEGFTIRARNSTVESTRDAEVTVKAGGKEAKINLTQDAYDPDAFIFIGNFTVTGQNYWLTNPDDPNSGREWISTGWDDIAVKPDAPYYYSNEYWSTKFAIDVNGFGPVNMPIFYDSDKDLWFLENTTGLQGKQKVGNYYVHFTSGFAPTSGQYQNSVIYFLGTGTALTFEIQSGKLVMPADTDGDSQYGEGPVCLVIFITEDEYVDPDNVGNGGWAIAYKDLVWTPATTGSSAATYVPSADRTQTYPDYVSVPVKYQPTNTERKAVATKSVIFK